MTIVPEKAQEFFTKYVPERFEKVRAGVAGKTSVGCLTFRVGDEAYSLRVRQGELEITPGMADDVILQVTIPEQDFKPVVVRGAELQERESLSVEQQLLAFKVLTVEPDRLDLVKRVQGSVAFLITESGTPHKLVITPGKGVPNVDQPDCRLECLMSDFMDMQLGKLNPMQLAMTGRIRIVGNAQLAMVLSGVFM